MTLFRVLVTLLITTHEPSSKVPSAREVMPFVLGFRVKGLGFRVRGLGV